MASKGDSTSSSVKPTSAYVSASGSDGSSVADIKAFLGGISQPTMVLPQSPWTVSSGHYTRPDGSVVYIEHSYQIRNTALNRSASSSMEVLTGGCNGASAQHGAKSGQ